MEHDEVRDRRGVENIETRNDGLRHRCNGRVWKTTKNKPFQLKIDKLLRFVGFLTKIDSKNQKQY